MEQTIEDYVCKVLSEVQEEIDIDRMNTIEYLVQNLQGSSDFERGKCAGEIEALDNVCDIIRRTKINLNLSEL